MNANQTAFLAGVTASQNPPQKPSDPTRTMRDAFGREIGTWTGKVSK